MSDAPVVFGAQRDVLLPVHAAISALAPTVLVRRPEQLTAALLDAVRPQWVILPDWSWIVPADLLARAAFVGFHPAALPAYRGGSPLQHQILDGVTDTTLSCFRMAPGLDSGAILLQEPLSLAGSIGEIWQRIAGLLPGMITRLLACDVQERPQVGTGFTRRRRTPAQSRLDGLGLPLAKLYDFIRMLDDPYPNAFLLLDGKRLRFRRAALDKGVLSAEVLIDEGDDHG